MNTFWRAGENVLVHLVPMLMWRMMTPLRMKPTRNTPNSFLEVIQSLYYSVRRKLIFSICACSVHEMWHFIGCCHTLYELMLRLHPLTLGIESSHTSSNLSACSRAYNKISEQHLLAVVRNSSTAQSDVMGFILQHRHHTPYKNRKKHYYYIYF